MDQQPREVMLVEAVLFAAAGALTTAEIAAAVNLPLEEAKRVLVELAARTNRGIVVVGAGDRWELATSALAAEAVERVAKVERGELTRPGLETLTVVAYRGPVSREEIEAIRGVNCALVLRNLQMRDLIEEETVGERTLYRLSLAALRHLGLNRIEDLPEYATYHRDARLTQLLERVLGTMESAS